MKWMYILGQFTMRGGRLNNQRGIEDVLLPIFNVSLRRNSEKDGSNLANECLLPKTCFDSKHTAELNRKLEPELA
jgi:hypothetical protein